MGDMRTHSQIVKDAGTDALPERASIAVSIHTVRSWRARDSIPGPYWQSLVDAGLATLDELAAAADVRRAANDDTSQDRAA